MSTDLSSLNDQQRNSIMESLNHNVVLMAAAGSGKTSTLVKRTQYLIDDLNVNPENIMMITFTNKAASEIKDRVSAVSSEAYKMWIGTFHKICTKLIRMFGSYLGIQNFSIMDTKDSKNLIKNILTNMGANSSPYAINAIMSKISCYKNNLVKPSQVMADMNEDRLTAVVYQEYQNISWRRKCFDFDDLIIYTILLLSSFKDVSQWVNNRFKYISVDECLTGNTYVDTEIGKIKIKELYNMYTSGKTLPLIKSFNISTEQYEYKPMTYAHKSNQRDVYEIHTEGLNKLRCTDNHKVLTQRGYVEVKDLIIGQDMLLLSNPEKQKTKLLLNNNQYQICLGSYLGDGYLDKRSKFNTYRLSFTQGKKQEEYFKSKISAFNLDYHIIKSGYTNKLNILHSDNTNTFILEDNPFELVLKNIDPLGLAIWYQDDGSLQQGRYVRIYSESFTYQQNIQLSEMLYNRFGIACNIKPDKKYYYLAMDKDNSDKFLSLISPYMHPSMQYKTNIDISKNIIKYDNQYKTYGANYIDNIHYIGKEDVYDITVNDNHNFIASTTFYTTGIIVHNCQDTNSAQFQLIKLLAGNNNIVLVGDTNQSIYAFRNAKPKYLENFANTHPNTIKLKLEQNYRSTKNIINAANCVINNNRFGTKIEMFCENETGELVQHKECYDAYDEARWIASEILSSNKPFSDFAIIYRANAQSRIIEEIFNSEGIGYTIFGAQSFYSRKEVRDLLAYCKMLINEFDIVSFKRILGTLKGVGKKTIEDIVANANKKKISYKYAISDYLKNNKLTAIKIHSLSSVSTILEKEYSKCSDIISDVLFYTGYKNDLLAVQTEETEEKLDIINEFTDMVSSMERNNPDITPAEVVDQISLLSDTKGEDKAKLDAVKLMTAHSSKGLEFDTVFIIGAEEGIFPHGNALSEGKEAIEEERRLFYVAMTRAKNKLYITNANQRRQGKDGALNIASPSRFLREIPSKFIEEAF